MVMTKVLDTWLELFGKIIFVGMAVLLLLLMTRHTTIGHGIFGVERQSSVNDSSSESLVAAQFEPVQGSNGCGCPVCCKA